MSYSEAPRESTRRSTRNPRRRQRDSDGTQNQIQPRRKRSKLSEDTFAPHQEDEVRTNGDLGLNGHYGVNGRKSSVGPSEASFDMPVRGGKKGTVKRAIKADGSIVMVLDTSAPCQVVLLTSWIDAE